MSRARRSTSIVAALCLVALTSLLVAIGPSATATETRFYFHSTATTINNIDKFFAESATFNTTPPEFTDPAVAVDLPAGTRLVVVGALMALVLIARPTGITGGREFPVGWLRR